MTDPDAEKTGGSGKDRLPPSAAMMFGLTAGISLSLIGIIGLISDGPSGLPLYGCLSVVGILLILLPYLLRMTLKP